jgi:hypothetical protein
VPHAGAQVPRGLYGVNWTGGVEYNAIMSIFDARGY